MRYPEDEGKDPLWLGIMTGIVCGLYVLTLLLNFWNAVATLLR